MRCSRGVLAAIALWSLWQSPSAEVLPSAASRVDERPLRRPSDLPDDATLEAGGALIGSVLHRRLNVFDETIPAEDTTLFRVANRIHIVTRESTLGAQLLFGAGDRFDARLLQESERILRSKPYLRDARIRPVGYHDGVDLRVGLLALRARCRFVASSGDVAKGSRDRWGESFIARLIAGWWDSLPQSRRYRVGLG